MEFLNNVILNREFRRNSLIKIIKKFGDVELMKNYNQENQLDTIFMFTRIVSELEILIGEVKKEIFINDFVWGLKTKLYRDNEKFYHTELANSFTGFFTYYENIINNFENDKKFLQRIASIDRRITAIRKQVEGIVSKDEILVRQESSFGFYLADRGKPLMRYLASNYKGCKIQKIAMMLLALNELDLLTDKLTNYHQEELAAKVGSVFTPQKKSKNNLTRQALNLSKYLSRKAAYQNKIDKEVELIRAVMPQLNIQ